MNDFREILIALRLLVGMALVLIAIVCGVGYCTATRDSIMIGAALATVVTFFTGVFFLSGALDPKLWKDAEPNQFRETPAELPAYDDRIERRVP